VHVLLYSCRDMHEEVSVEHTNHTTAHSIESLMLQSVLQLLTMPRSHASISTLVCALQRAAAS
jgi:hypothetical protein